jgi:hypothetical protein
MNLVYILQAAEFGGTDRVPDQYREADVVGTELEEECSSPAEDNMGGLFSRLKKPCESSVQDEEEADVISNEHAPSKDEDHHGVVVQQQETKVEVLVEEEKSDAVKSGENTSSLLVQEGQPAGIPIGEESEVKLGSTSVPHSEQGPSAEEPDQSEFNA